jgi:lipopolysaccharide exporter
MQTMLSICALNFLLLPFSTISLALLRREMAFKKLAVVGLFAATVGALVSTGLAWGGMGAPSLAIGSVATT